MRCNACWRELEGRAISTICGHILCTEDASKILSNDGSCPICDQVLSKSCDFNVCFVAIKALTFKPTSHGCVVNKCLVKPVDLSPTDDWINMSMAGISPQLLMKSAYRSVMFYIGQKELEMQFKMNRIVAQYKQKCEMMQEKFTEKLEQVHGAYQKAAKRCQMLEQENETLSKDIQELQEKFSEKSRQKRKLDEMYDQLRTEFESAKRSAIEPVRNFYPRSEPDFFPNQPNAMERDPTRQDWSVFTPKTPGPRDDMWPAKRQNSSNSGPFDVSGGSPAKKPGAPFNAGNRNGADARSAFGMGPTNPSMTLRNLILSPIERPQPSRGRAQMFRF